MRTSFVVAATSLLGASLCVLSNSSASAQGLLGATSTGALTSPTIADRIRLIADRDDDDADDEPDGEAVTLAPAARADLVALDPKYVGATLTPVSNSESARLVVNGRTLAWGERVPAGASLQGLSPGHIVLRAKLKDRESAIAVDVYGVGLRDGARKAVDLARERASLERTPPARVDLEDADRAFDDPDALRVVLSSPTDAPPLAGVSVESLAADGTPLDTLRDVRLLPVACDKVDPSAQATTCVASAPLRFVVDEVDRAHPLVRDRSLRAEVGGAIVMRDAAGRKLQAVRVAGPRQSPAGAIGRYKMTIRPIVMRLTAGGAPAVGGTDAGAVLAIRQELALASATWGQCGITFGDVKVLDVKVVSPPPPYLVTVGDDVGLPASGGEIRMKVDGKALRIATKKGWSTRQVALELQRAATRAGLSATLSENARISPGAAPSVDVVMKRANGELAAAELVSSSDATLSVSVGSVDLTDGLLHFGDTDSVAGTLEERTLVKAVEDGDPRTIEVIVVPFFSGGGRIGESFIASDGSSMRNVVILDRAGVRARRTSFTLAHELGHVILDEPGHPDDYGLDTPTRLMDSDASDSSPFGPRRLTVDECARAVRQSGPQARLPLLAEQRLTAMKLR